MFNARNTQVEEPNVDVSLITPDNRKRNVESSSSSSSSSEYCTIVDKIFVDGSLKKQYTVSECVRVCDCFLLYMFCDFSL
jgi:hypothetical protein